MGILPGLIVDVKNKILAKEDRLAALGIDNRDVPNRKLNSRGADSHLGVRSLQDASDYDALLAFNEHLGDILKGVRSEDDNKQ